MTWSAYSRLKDSGIEWLGHIPSSWDVRSLRHLGEAIIGLTYAPEDVVDSGPDATLVLRASNIQGGSLHFGDVVYVSSLIPPHLRIRRGDLLVCSRSGSRDLIGKNVYITGDVVGQTFGAFMTVFRSEFNRYLYWVFNSRLFDYQTATFLTSTINQLTAGNLKGMKVPFPTSSEQRAICEFLEAETAKIDALIAKQEQLITALGEDRTATITHAVTKGLDADVLMSDIGSPWVGRSPSRWVVTKFRRTATVKPGFAFPSESFTDTGIPVLRIGDISPNGTVDLRASKYLPPEMLTSHRRFVVSGGEIVMAMTGATTGKPGRLSPDSVALLNQRVCSMSGRREMLDNQFLWYLIKSQPYQRYVAITAFGGAQPNISDTELTNFTFALPPKDEQHRITAYLDSATAKIDGLVQKSAMMIETLREYRSALITDAVTGKIDVRGAS